MHTPIASTVSRVIAVTAAAWRVAGARQALPCTRQRA